LQRFAQAPLEVAGAKEPAGMGESYFFALSLSEEPAMLGTRDAVANLAVRDIARAREFYTSVLGLTEVDKEGEELIVLESGDTVVNVYRSEYAGTNKATAVTWQVEDIEAEVAALRAKGVAFEHYDMPGLALEGDIHAGFGMKVAWFKDPDGNILNVVQR
jgi:catechol 2,3-dioxygenase-like lactoylglutathione lyase family enzyme